MAGPTPVEVTRDVYIKSLCKEVRYTTFLSQLVGIDQQFVSRGGTCTSFTDSKLWGRGGRSIILLCNLAHPVHCFCGVLIKYR